MKNLNITVRPWSKKNSKQYKVFVHLTGKLTCKTNIRLIGFDYDIYSSIFVPGNQSDGKSSFDVNEFFQDIGKVWSTTPIKKNSSFLVTFEVLLSIIFLFLTQTSRIILLFAFTLTLIFLLLSLKKTKKLLSSLTATFSKGEWWRLQRSPHRESPSPRSSVRFLLASQRSQIQALTRITCFLTDL